MKQTYHTITLILVLGLGHCGGNITEVGNPTTLPTTIQTSSAITHAISEGLTGTLLSFGADEMGERDSTQEFSCAYAVASDTVTCECPGGGSIVKVFNEGVETATEGQTSFSHSVTESYADCVVASCGEDITLNGTLQTVVVGDFNSMTESGQLTVTHQTEAACSGILAGETPFGFNVTVSIEDQARTIAGSLCIGEELLTFVSIDELRELVDPDNQCPEGFNFEEGDSEEDVDDEDNEESEEEMNICMDCFDQCLASGDSTGEACLDQCQEQGLCQ